MSVSPGPYDIDATRLIFGPDGGAMPKNASPDFYAELDEEFAEFKNHLLIQRFEFDTDWPTTQPHERTVMLFVTPGEGTLNETSPPEDVA